MEDRAMAKIITTGVLNNRTYAPGACMECGMDDGWQVDGRGNVLCDCQACPDCGMIDAYNFHESGCPQIGQE